MKTKIPQGYIEEAMAMSGGRKRKRRRVQRVVRPPFRLNQVIRHNVSGEQACIVAVDKEILRAEPITTAYFLYPPYDGWEAV